MEQLKIPDGYSSPLTIRETEVAIKEVKDHFDTCICSAFCPPGIRNERQSERR